MKLEYFQSLENWDGASKPKSNRIRIETNCSATVVFYLIYLKTKIQQNKDWNKKYFSLPLLPDILKTKIQQNKDWNGTVSGAYNTGVGILKTKIQQNKDWNKLIFRLSM